MQSFSEMQSTAGSMFSAYASLAATVMLFRSVINDVIPASLMSRIMSFISYFFAPPSKLTTIVIDEQSGMSRNVVYESAEVYLGTKISPNTDRFKVNKTPKQKSLNITVEKDQVIVESFREVEKLEWRFVSIEPQNNNQLYTPEKRFFELSFRKEHRDVVVDEYLPFVLKRADEIKNLDKAVKLYTRDCPYNDDEYNGGGGNGVWGSVNLDHPSTFDKLAMEPEMKKALIQDLDRFVRRKDYYRKVGKAWKRGYLLYGPPGTGKSSLIAAIANYLKFDVYDLELTSLYSNSELRRIMLSTTNRSIIVIEDIDCSLEMHDRQQDHQYNSPNEYSNTKLTLSGLLNFIDGLWSCCGDERIIVFTTNHKDKLDPALLRPGRMDRHIHLSYCTPAGFRILASNYQGIDRDYDEGLFNEIEGLIEICDATPAAIAEELMRSEDADAALQGVRTMLNKKLAEKNAAAEVKDDDDGGVPSPSSCPEGEEFEDVGVFEMAGRMRSDRRGRRPGLRTRRRYVRGGRGRGRGGGGFYF